jgi:hypothetical protein
LSSPSTARTIKEKRGETAKRTDEIRFTTIYDLAGVAEGTLNQLDYGQAAMRRACDVNATKPRDGHAASPKSS